MNRSDFSSFLEDTECYETIPIVRRFITDTLTPIQMFQNLENEAVFLLESNDSESPWSRFSFIGINPFLWIEEKDRTFHISNAEKKTIFETNTLKNAFEKIQQILNVKPVHVDIPFKGGAVGYISYDAVDLFEKVPEHRCNDLNMAKCVFMFCETMICFDHQSNEISIIQYVRLEKQALTKSEKRKRFDIAQKKINNYIQKLSIPGRTHDILFLDDELKIDLSHIQSNYTKEAFIHDVNKIKDFIRAGDIFQAVLSQRFEIPLHVTGFEIYRVLRKINPSPYLFFIKLNEFELIGSSPERLIKIENGHLEIHPIAGTRRRGRTDEEDERLALELINDEKELAEHYMLVDLARNDIGRVAKYGTVQTPVLLQLTKFSHVMHLISKVTGNLADGIHPIEALLSSFPAGTVSGAPKVRAMQLINQIEPTARNVYAGAVAYIGFDGNIDSCIAIRTAIVRKGIAYIQAGAGIVADSIPELEWKETINKAKALVKAVHLAHEMFAERSGV
jgi:anthranilate synthase component I